MRDPLAQSTVDPRRGLAGLLVALAALIALGIANPTALGTILVLLGVILMIMIHEGGHYLTAKWSDMKVTEFFVGFGPRLWAFRRGETDYGVKPFILGGYVRIIGMNNLEEVDPEDEPRTFRSKPYRNRLLVAVAGSSTHFVMAILLIWIILSGFGVPDYDRPTTVVDGLVKSAPAEASGVKVGDRVLAINGQEVDEWNDVPALVEPNANRELVLTIEREGRPLELTATPEARELEGGGTAGFLGIAPGYEDVKEGTFAGLGESFRKTGSIAKESVLAIGRFFSPSNLADYGESLTGGRAPPNDTRFLSPVGATQVASQAVEEGLREVLTFLALINIFVGTLNMFPLPPLDGGHVAVATYEKVASTIKGRRVQVDMAKIMPVAAVVVTILLFIGLSALWLDIFEPVDVGF